MQPDPPPCLGVPYAASRRRRKLSGAVVGELEAERLGGVGLSSDDVTFWADEESLKSPELLVEGGDAA